MPFRKAVTQDHPDNGIAAAPGAEIDATVSGNCCRGADANLHVIERFTRVSGDTIDYQYTVDDPTTYTRKWTVAVPLTKAEGAIYEYACHEGNYGMANLLSGARARERASERDGSK